MLDLSRFTKSLRLAGARRTRSAGWLGGLLLIFGGSGAFAHSAQSSPPLSEYVFDAFGPEFGLPQTNVTAALQTRDGYLWVGTEGGLGRFDGVRFAAFKRSNTPAFGNHSIRRLYEDSAGALWIGTESGVVHHRDGVFTHVGLSGAMVTAIAQDQSGRMWFGTDGRGLHSFEQGQFRSYEEEPVMPGLGVRTIFVDSADRVWIGFTRTPHALCFENGRFRSHEIGVSAKEIFAIAEWPRGTLWFACGRGLYRMTGDTATRCDWPGGLAHPQVTDVQLARDGGLWVVAGGVFKVAQADPFVCKIVPRLPTAAARTVVEDREGSLWICAHFDGLIQARRMYYRTISTDDGLPGRITKAVSQDPAGNIWVAIQSHGLARVAPNGDISTFSRADGLPSHDPLSILVARDGAIWVGYSVGLAVWREGRIETFRDYRNARIIHQDKRGNLWFGTDEQLLMRTPEGRFVPIDLGHGKPVMVNAIAEDSEGALYVATSPGGLAVLQSDRIERYDERIGFPESGVRALHVDDEQRVWVGSKGRGLGVLIDSRWFNPDVLADAVTDHVSAIAEDDRGQLWLGTPSGIMWASKRELMAVALGEQTAVHMRLAGLSDGSRATPASSHSQPTVWRTRQQTLLFATRRGLVEIDPNHTFSNTVAPPVQIEAVIADGKPMPRTGRLELAPGVRQLLIEYTAPSFVEPRRVAFRYKLDGYDREWIEAGPQRIASYGNLPSGHYTFHVIACNSDGQWNEVGDRIEIRQLPFFYETWWFATIAAGALGAMGFGAFRWSHRRLERELERMEQKHALERERHRIAKNLHDDLGANLTEIGLFAETARRRTSLPEAIDDMVELSNRVRGLVGSLDAIVWAANPANDSLDELAAYICEYFQSLFVRSPIRCRVDVADDIPAFPLTPEERTNLFLTVKEAMNNVLKHSAATHVWLRMKMDGNRFWLLIEDDGRGFDPTALENARGNGLRNMRSRIEELSGTFAIEASPGQHTCLTISVSFAGKKTLSHRNDPDRNHTSHAPSPF